MALDSTKIKAGTVLSTIMNMDVLAQKKVVKLFWVKAHIGTQGNELADRLVKTRTVKVTEAEPIILVPVAERKRDIREAVEHKWTARWTSTKEAR
jgi:hypothetical protein